MPLGSFDTANEQNASENSFGSGSSFNSVNPFNDTSSAFGDVSSESNSGNEPAAGQQPQHILPEIQAFANNFDKLDGILSHFTAAGDASNVVAANQNNAKIHNPFVVQRAKSPALNDLKGMDLCNAGTMNASKTFDGNRVNYDALRESIECGTINSTCPPLATNMSLVTNQKTGEKPQISMDLFKDAAAAAFNEFGGSANGKAKKHEFFNRISEVGFNGTTISNNDNNNDFNGFGKVKAFA